MQRVAAAFTPREVTLGKIYANFTRPLPDFGPRFFWRAKYVLGQRKLSHDPL